MNPEEAKNTYQDLQNNIGYIYCLSFKNGKKYIGQTIKQWKYRWKQHKSNKSFCKALHSAIMKHGIQNISFQILEYCKTKEELNKRQNFYIQNLKTLSPNGYNLKKQQNRIVYSLKTRMKMSESRNKKLKNFESDKIYKRYIRQICYYDEGMNILPFICQINDLSFTVSEKMFSFYFRQKNKWKSKEYREKMVQNKKTSIRQKNSKKVMFKQKNQIYQCAGEIVEKFPEYNFTKTGIQHCCSNRKKSYKGFHFNYI